MLAPPRQVLRGASTTASGTSTFTEADAASPAPSALGAAFSDMMRITPAHSTRSSVVGHALFEAGEDGGPQTLVAVHSGIQALDAVGLCGQGGPVR